MAMSQRKARANSKKETTSSKTILQVLVTRHDFQGNQTERGKQVATGCQVYSVQTGEYEET